MRFHALLLIALLPIPALAESSNPIAAGDGMLTCNQFLSVAHSSTKHEEHYFQWAEGFMSGMNAMFGPAHTPIKNLASMSKTEQRAAISAYCSFRPNDTYESAVIKFYSSLPNAHIDHRP